MCKKQLRLRLIVCIQLLSCSFLGVSLIAGEHEPISSIEGNSAKDSKQEEQVFEKRSIKKIEEYQKGDILDGDIGYLLACKIVAAHKEGLTNDLALRIVVKQYEYRFNEAKQLAAHSHIQLPYAPPPVQVVGSVEELSLAIKKCPKGSPVVIAAHGLGREDREGFGTAFLAPNLDAESNLNVYARDKKIQAVYDAMASRSITSVTFHSCSLGASAEGGKLGMEGVKDPKVGRNFGNVFANALYAALNRANVSNQKTPIPKVIVFSKNIGAGEKNIFAIHDNTEKITFTPNESYVAELENERASKGSKPYAWPEHK